jgi:hypothetical protein
LRTCANSGYRFLQKKQQIEKPGAILESTESTAEREVPSPRRAQILHVLCGSLAPKRHEAGTARGHQGRRAASKQGARRRDATLPIITEIP